MAVNEPKDLPKPRPRLGRSFFLGIAAIMVAIAISLALRWWQWSGGYVGDWAWWSVFVILLGGCIAVVVTGTRVLREFLAHYREQRFLMGLRAEAQQVPEEGIEQEQRRLREKMQEAIRTVQQSPVLRQKGGLPLYAVPWYLLIGAQQSGKTTLLRSVASSFAPFERPSSSAEAPTQNCDWWFFNTAIILDTAGSYAFPVQGERDSTQWFRFLQLLRYYRELLPINGLIVAVGADTLAVRRHEDLRLEAAELRKRIDEAIRELGVDFPIYILITRCDLIEGFTEFFGCLPAHVQRQVFGYARESRPGATHQQSETTAMQRLEAAHEQTVERLKHLRLSILNGEKLPPAGLRQKIYCFPEEFQALHQPLNVFVEALVAENPFQHKPFFRALFFSSAQQQGSPHSLLRRQLHFDYPIKPLAPGTTPYFLHDLFAVILQRDQYLARRTGRAMRGRLFRNLSIFGAGLALCVLLLLLLTWTFFSDRRVLASVNQEPCAAALGQQHVEPLLEQAEGCRQVVQGLIDQNRQRFTWSKLVFNRSGRLEGELRQRYVEKFQSEVLAPLDADMHQQLTTSSDAVPWVFTLIKRIELIHRCLSGFRCPHPLAEEMRPDYPLMLTAVLRRPPSAVEVTTLGNTYEAYLAWAVGSEEVLQQEQAAHAERLRQWFSAKQFAPQQIVRWANQKYTPVTIQAFWKGAVTGEGRSGFQIDGAYTPAAWKQSILPFLQRAGDAVPELDPQLKEFQHEYRRQYFEQWQRFLASFPQGELPWWRTREQRRQLASKLLDAESPYNRIVDVAFAELKPLLPVMMVAEVSLNQAAQDPSKGKFAQLLSNAWQTVSQLWPRRPPSNAPEHAPATDTEPPPIPLWVHTLQHYIRSENRQAYLSALKDMRQQLGEDVPMEKSFQIAQALFQEGGPSEKSTHPLFKAWWMISQFRDTEGSRDPTLDKSFWPLLERPVLIAWKVILEGSGEFLQRTWADNVVAPTRALSELEQADFLYGSQGKVREFVDKFVKPFLVDNESRLGQPLGEEVPLGPAFFKVLRDEKQVKPILELGKKTPFAVRVGVTRDSAIESQTNLTEEKTDFQVDCGAKTFKVSNRPKEGTEASTVVFWSPDSCSDAIVTVFLSCDQRCVRGAADVGMTVPELSSLPIARRYKGQTGFLRFLQEFNAGSRTFVPGEFTESSSPSESPKGAEMLRRYRVSAIRVSFRTEVPPTLTTLMTLLPGLKPPAAITKP
jgi:type VI secretion system protein ImpL